MTEKHYPYCGGSFDRIIFDEDGSVWVPETENAKLREQMERLVTLLRVDCDIDASWDGLRRFWSIGLTESGCLMRDRACKAEAENEKLREERDTYRDLVGCMVHPDIPDQLYAENVKLRELVADMWACISHIGEYDVFYYDMAKDGCGISCTVNGEHCCADKLCNRMRELGIEVDA